MPISGINGVRLFWEQTGDDGVPLVLVHGSCGDTRARQFVEHVAFGPGMWEKLPSIVRQTFVFNAPRWLDEMNERPALITNGDQKPNHRIPQAS